MQSLFLEGVGYYLVTEGIVQGGQGHIIITAIASVDHEAINDVEYGVICINVHLIVLHGN